MILYGLLEAYVNNEGIKEIEVAEEGIWDMAPPEKSYKKFIPHADLF